jgi:hypothetical protein
MNNMIPRFMDPDFHLSEAFRGANSEERKFAEDLALEGVAVVSPEVDDFDALARDVISQTKVILPGKGRLQDAWRRIAAVRAIAANRHIMDLLEFAYGRRSIPFQTLNFTVGTEQATHSDTIHFSSFPHNFMCGVWVAYEDTDTENGALHYVPGSHKLRAMAPEDFGIESGSYRTRNDTYKKYEVALADYISALGMKRAKIPLKKGQALVWTANLFHGGEPVLNSSRTRYSQVTHYYFDRCLYFSPLWSNLHGGRVMYKKVFDIASDHYVSSYYNGKPFRLPLTAHAREFLLAKLIKVRKS